MQKSPHILLFNPDQWRGDAIGHLGNPAGVTPNVDDWVRSDAVSFAKACCQATVCTSSRCSFATGLYPHVFGHRSLHHLLNPDRGETHMLKVLKDSGYFVWWGGKNDLITSDYGPEAHSDIYFEPDAAFFERHQSTPQSDMHHGDQSWRGTPGSDTYYSFFKGELHRDPSDRYYMDGDWQKVLGAIEFIKSAPSDQPLCIYLPLLFPHPPYGVETEFYDSVGDIELPRRRTPNPDQWPGKSAMLRGIRVAQGLADWDESRWDLLRRTYYGMIARVDRQFAMVLDALRQAGLYEDTGVVLFSDHGDYTGDYDVVEKAQNTFEDPLVRVPLIVKPPSGHKVTPGVRDHVMAELVDVAATVFEWAGVDPGYDHFGRSLTPSIADPSAPHKDFAFCEGGRREQETQVSEADTLARFGPLPQSSLYFPRVNIQVNDPDAHSRTVMIRSLRYKYIRRLSGEDEFYDLDRDPDELDNRIADATYSEEIEYLKNSLITWYLDTSDIVPRKIDSR